MTTRLITVADPRSYAPASALVVPLSSHIRKKREFFGVIRKHLKLPGYFGGNWDALHDCLRDNSWLPEDTEIVLRHDGVPFAEASTQRAIYLELLQSLLQTTGEGHPQITIVWPASLAVPNQLADAQSSSEQ